MDTDRIVIAHPDLPSRLDGHNAVRALVHPDSQAEWSAAGWNEVGPWCGVPDSMATVDEHAAAQDPEAPSTPTPRRRKAAEKSE